MDVDFILPDGFINGSHDINLLLIPNNGIETYISFKTEIFRIDKYDYKTIDSLMKSSNKNIIIDERLTYLIMYGILFYDNNILTYNSFSFNVSTIYNYMFFKFNITTAQLSRYIKKIAAAWIICCEQCYLLHIPWNISNIQDTSLPFLSLMIDYIKIYYDRKNETSRKNIDRLISMLKQFWIIDHNVKCNMKYNIFELWCALDELKSSEYSFNIVDFE
jgi:hypothetical protein